MRPQKRGPKVRSDAELVEEIHQLLAEPIFTGEGYRKIWARLRHKGDRTSKDSVLRLLREHQLLAPSRQPDAAPSNPHDGSIVTTAPDQMWGTDATTTVTVAEGTVNVFAAIDHCTAECVGIHAVKKATRFEALEPIRQGVKEHFGAFSNGAAAGLCTKTNKLGFVAGLPEGERGPYRERLEFELRVIIEMGFAGYFLIVADFIQWAKRQQPPIPVGPGRGSGAGSVVAWSLTITDLDPLRFNLLFERFLNPERVSMPDFDIDFDDARRGEVITTSARSTAPTGSPRSRRSDGSRPRPPSRTPLASSTTASRSATGSPRPTRPT